MAAASDPDHKSGVDSGCHPVPERFLLMSECEVAHLISSCVSVGALKQVPTNGRKLITFVI